MRRRGFTLVEIVVVIALIALLAAVLLPAVLRRITDARGSALAQTLDAAAQGALEYRADLRRYPTHLRHLVTAPTSGVKDLCNQTVPSDYLSNWKGPYLDQTFGTEGIRVGEATVRDSLELSPAGPYTVSSDGFLLLVALNVDSALANQLESAFDNSVDFSAGTIRYTAGTGGQGTLRYAIPVRGC